MKSLRDNSIGLPVGHCDRDPAHSLEFVSRAARNYGRPWAVSRQVELPSPPCVSSRSKLRTPVGGFLVGGAVRREEALVGQAVVEIGPDELDVVAESMIDVSRIII